MKKQTTYLLSVMTVVAGFGLLVLGGGLGLLWYTGEKPTGIADNVPSVTITPVLTTTQRVASVEKEVITLTITVPTNILAQYGSTVLEVWQFLPEQRDSWSRLYTVTYPLDKSNEVTIPAQEIERMKNYLAAQSSPLQLPKIPLFERYPVYLALSPTIERLAFVEWNSVFVTNSQEALFGVGYIGDLGLETNQLQIPFQSPARVFVNEIDYLVSLTDPLWSPDAQYYSVQYNLVHQDSSPLIVNVNTGAVQRLEGEANLLGPLAWSPDSDTIFLYLYRSGFDSSGGLIRLCKVELLSCRDIELDGVWIEPSGVDWAIYKNQIVLVGSNEDINWATAPPPFGLYLFDPETEAIYEVLDDFNNSLRDPRWSPNSQFIAVEYNTEGVVASPNTIVIVEPDSKQVLTEIVIEGCDWQWEQSSQAIVQLPCGGSEPHNLIVSSIFDASRRQIELPIELRLARRLGFSTLKLP